MPSIVWCRETGAVGYDREDEEKKKTIQLQVMMQAAQQYAHDVGNSSSIPISSSSFGQMLELMADGGQFGTNSSGLSFLLFL